MKPSSQSPFLPIFGMSDKNKYRYSDDCSEVYYVDWYINYYASLQKEGNSVIPFQSLSNKNKR